MFDLVHIPPLEEIRSGSLEKKKVRIFIKRDDQIDSEISGNKWRKLKYNFLEARSQGFKNILTFGGAFSNHIAATAAAARAFGFQSIGIIRGHELNDKSNPTLSKAHRDGMDLKFISRDQYRKRKEPGWLNELQQMYKAFFIPEGGSNDLAVKGVGEMMNEIDEHFDYIVCPVGTGGTLAGIVSGLQSSQQAIGISVLKGMSDLEDSVSVLSGLNSNFHINHYYHFGGYGKFNTSLIEFMQAFYQEYKIVLDPIYTGKMMYGVLDMIDTNQIPTDSKIICLHTGGLQGISGFNEKHQLSLPTIH